MITKAIIQSYDAGTHTMSVQPVGNLGTYWKDIKIAVTIPAGDCAVASFNESHPTDAVVIATWS